MACKTKTKLWDSITKDELQTTTQAMLEEGAKRQTAIPAQKQKLLNFQSFSMEDPRYGTGVEDDGMEPPMLSSYRRQFSQPYPNRCKPLTPKTESPDWLFNRRPKNDFEPMTGMDSKFLDDHMHDLSDARRRINFFRQLRNQSFLQY